MQRRNFLGTIVAAGLVQARPASRQDLTPAEFRRQWIERARATGIKPSWTFQPSEAIEPFMDWYPGDEWVSGWTITAPPAGPASAAMIRSFTYEGQRRGFRVQTSA